MSDIAIQWDGLNGDLAIEGNDLARDDGLETAVILSLFLEREAAADDLPAHEANRGGWWGDALNDISGDREGSRLWLLARERQTPEVLTRCKQYVREALTWMLEDGVASRLEVDAEFAGEGALYFAATIHRPTGDSESFKYKLNWAAHAVERV